MAAAQPQKKKDIVIVGGGIIGCTSAYFLTRHPSFDPQQHSITLLEASTVAGGASGKAGGLLALWAYPSNIVPLSFRLHAELAKEHGGEQRWGYRRLHCGSMDATVKSKDGKQTVKEAKASEADGQKGSLHKQSAAALGQLRKAGFPADLDWLSADSARGYSEMGTPEDTAQVHPRDFTTSIADLAEKGGAKIVTGAFVDSVNESSADGSSSVESVTYTRDGEQKTIPASHVVVAAGPWTGHLQKDVPVQGQRAHSVTIRPSREVSAYALFTAINLPRDFGSAGKGLARRSGTSVHPEIYARPFNEVYACGDGDSSVPLPRTTAEVEVDNQRCQDIIDQVSSISDELRDGEVTVRQACYLPVVRGGGSDGPFIGEMRHCKNLIVAAGHSVWGIQNGPGTGKLVSEIVMDGKAKSAKLGQLDPTRVL